MMAPISLGLARLCAYFLRLFFSLLGLYPRTLSIDDTTTIHFWAPKPGPHKTHKPNLLLLHPFGPPAIWTWIYQIPTLIRHFNLYLPDLVFFGHSTSSSDQRSEAFQAASMGRLMEIIGVNRFHVIGTSYGGFVAYKMARMWPDRVEKVVIASSGVNLRKSDNDALIKRAKRGTLEEVMLPSSAGELRTLAGLALSYRALWIFPSIFFNDFVQEVYRSNRKEKKELLEGLSFGKDENVSHLTPLQQDVLIIWGDEDKIFPLKMALELKEILGSKTRLEVIPKAAHVPQAEKPREFNKLVNNFLRDS